MNQETSSEDRTILAALEALERGIPYPALPPGQRDEVAETLARLYTEVLGLIPSELEPVVPRPEVKARLMALIAGEETQDVRVEAPAPPLARPVPAPVAFEPTAEPVGPAEPVAEASPQEPGGGALSREAGEGWGGGAPEPIRPMAPSGSAVASVTDLPARPVPPRPAAAVPVRRPASRWPLTLAAVLALALLGLSLWLGAANLRQRETIANLESQLAQQAQQSERLRAAESQLQELRTLSQVAQYAVEASPLQPVGEAPMFPEARGVLLVAPDHQHWYMSVRNLGPAGEGRVYQLWFVSDSGTVSGGTFTARPGEPAELSSEEMPSGIRGVVVTLEPGQGSAAPTGPEVLRATNVYPIV